MPTRSNETTLTLDVIESPMPCPRGEALTRLALLAASLLVGCLPPSEGALEDDVGAVGAGGMFEGHVPLESDGPALRARRVTGIAVEVFDDGIPAVPAVVPRSLRLNLFADAVYDASLTRARREGGSVVWSGAVVDHPGSRVSLAFREGAVSGSVRVGGRVFAILPHPDGATIVEHDEASMPDDAPSVMPDPASLPAPPVALDRAPPAAADGISEIDVLIVYTQAARAEAGAAGIRATIDLALAQANEGLARSGVPARFHLLDAVETAYDEAGFDFHATLRRLSTPGDGWLDDAPRLRDELGADHVVLMVSHASPYAGLGYQLNRLTEPFFAPFAYSVVSFAYAVSSFTLAHELGHNLGANHDLANATEAGWRPDAHGHQVPEAGYRTIMAYACSATSCPRDNVWSSPARQHEGRPTGVAGVSDNATTLTETAPIAAAFRERSVAVAAPARIVRPTDGSVLPAGAVTFEWTDVGADEYLLYVGDAAGDGTHFGGSLGSRTSVTLTGLPATGEPVYARLFTRHGATTVSFDASYTTARELPPRARLTFPDRQLFGSWSHFAWHDVGALEYRLEVGTLTDPTRYHVSRTRDCSRLVAGLPGDGSEVIARVSTRGPDGWTTFAAVHRAWTAPDFAASITRPAPGSTLRGPDTSFRWVSTDATDHWVVVNDEAGVVASARGARGRARITGLPTDGRDLWVALYSLGPSGWVATSASYQAAH